VLEDAERLIVAWNERQALRAPMIFSPTIGAAIKAGFWFLWVRCPACRTINAIDLRRLDRHHAPRGASELRPRRDLQIRSARLGSCFLDQPRRGICSIRSPSDPNDNVDDIFETESADRDDDV
jgi:hypothetical protein